MIKILERFKRPDSPNRFLTIEMMVDFYANQRINDEVIKLISEKLADEFIKEHGSEILKKILEKTIDAKVIQKVVENLRKELE